MSTTSFKAGDRVRWTGKRQLGSYPKTFATEYPNKVGKLGTVEGHATVHTARVTFDDGEVSTGTYFDNLELVETKTVGNIKTATKIVLDALLAPQGVDSAKERAVRRLGIGSALVTRGEAEKKKAKTELKELGVTRDEYAASTTETIFDSERYTVEAVTNAGSQRLDATALEAAMLNEGISAAKRIRIMKAAMKDIKPSTSFKVESK